MNKIAVYLNKQISGNVFDKDSILEAYSTDRSVLKIKPKFVAFPENTEDVEKLLEFIDQLAEKDYKLPIGIWGSGLDTTGADLTTGLLISTEKMNKIKEIDAHDRLIHIQSGVTLGQLNSALSTHGLTLPIDENPSETIGSLIANCPTDPMASFYGGIMNFIDRIEVVIPNGETIQTSPQKPKSIIKKQSSDNLEGKIYRELLMAIAENDGLMQKFLSTQDLSGYPSISRCSIDGGKTFDLLPIFYGSQGTLGVITEIILHVEPIPSKPLNIITAINSLDQAIEILKEMKALHPIKLLFFDSKIFEYATKLGKDPTFFSKKIPENSFVIQASFKQTHLSKQRIQTLFNSLPKSTRLMTPEDEKTQTQKTILNSLSAFLNPSSKTERTPIIHNFHIPSSELENLMQNLKILEKKYKAKLSIYGSFATNIYSIRPEIDLETDEGRTFIVEFLRDFNLLLSYHKGHLAGGTPEGRLKALLTNHSLSKEEKNLYKNIKGIFDKNNILSPDIKLNTNPKTISNHFRTNNNLKIQF